MDKRKFEGLGHSLGQIQKNMPNRVKACQICRTFEKLLSFSMERRTTKTPKSVLILNRNWELIDDVFSITLVLLVAEFKSAPSQANGTTLIILLWFEIRTKHILNAQGKS